METRTVEKFDFDFWISLYTWSGRRVDWIGKERRMAAKKAVLLTDSVLATNLRHADAGDPGNRNNDVHYELAPARPGDDVRWVYSIVSTKPRALLQHARSLVRHGQLFYLSPTDEAKKPRYF